MKRFQKDFLATMRQQRDPLADKAVEVLFSSERGNEFRKLIAQMSLNSDVPRSDFLVDLKTFFEETDKLPSWADRRKLQRASRFFQQNVVQIMSLLGTYALPYCYAAADGAQVLYLSERIKKDTNNRLLETALFIFDLFEPHALKPKGRAFRSTQKVRLIHAAIRLHIGKYGQWNEAWGKPVNQEDMAGTNLAFSLIILRGLKKIGCNVTPEDSEAWLHAWCVFGYLMGVDKQLLPENIKEAFILEKNIRERNFKPSEAGKELTASLIKHYRNLPEVAKFPKGYMPSYMRYVLGNEVADLLSVPQADWSSVIVQQYRLFNILGVSPNQEPLTRDLLIQQLSYEPKFETPEGLGV